MPTYLSPGVFIREVDQSAAPSNVGPLRPAFVGTAKKGPMNIPTLVTSAAQFIETFGEPFPNSYLGYGALSYFEQGNQAYIVRVGVSYDDAQDEELQAIAIDESGNKNQGWGRIPVFAGVDFGRLNVRVPSDAKPIVIHAGSVSNITFTDFDATSASVATLTFSDEVSNRPRDESYTMVITGAPTGSGPVEGATYEIVRNSDGQVVTSGALAVSGTDDTISDSITGVDGLAFTVTCSTGALDVNDQLRFTAAPDNTKFTVLTNVGTGAEVTVPAGTYSSATTLITALNTAIALPGPGTNEYAAVLNGDVIQLISETAGHMIQLASGEAFALEVGLQLWSYDVPRSHFVGSATAPHSIQTSNDRVRLEQITATGTEVFDFSIPNGNNWTHTDIAAAFNGASTKEGDKFFIALEMTGLGGKKQLLVMTNAGHIDETIKLAANASHIETLRFAEELGVAFPYSRAYRSFTDSRTALPTVGVNDATIPRACELVPGGPQCLLDNSYYANIVGWIVATSAGTWVDDYRVNIELQPQGFGDLSGRYRVSISDEQGGVIEVIDDVSFDPRAIRYIANVVNPGSSIGGQNGNDFINWIERPAFLDNDPNAVGFEVRLPAQFRSRAFVGQADGIPTDTAYSNELDAAVIGNPAEATGIYGLENAETIDINLLSTPGFSSGAVIGQCLQLCERRGDMIYLVDPPFGLRPQQIVDWHNGMLSSDLASAINSSYGALYWGWMRIFDQFNQQNIWVPPSGHVAAVFSKTARETEQWFAPAGPRRGVIQTATAVEYSPSQGERDLLYGSGNAVNPMVNFPQEGITVYGQRTLQRNETALSRVNVRMLLSYIRKNMSRILRQYVFEPNDDATAASVQNVIEGFLATIAERRGLDGYLVITDGRVNTPATRDANILNVAILIKPTRAIEYVQLTLSVLRSSASFDADETLAAAGFVQN